VGKVSPLIYSVIIIISEDQITDTSEQVGEGQPAGLLQLSFTMSVDLTTVSKEHNGKELSDKLIPLLCFKDADFDYC
jgi:hypothetical protein